MHGRENEETVLVLPLPLSREVQLPVYEALYLTLVLFAAVYLGLDSLPLGRDRDRVIPKGPTDHLGDEALAEIHELLDLDIELLRQAAGLSTKLFSGWETSFRDHVAHDHESDLLTAILGHTTSCDAGCFSNRIEVRLATIIPTKFILHKTSLKVLCSPCSREGECISSCYDYITQNS